MGDWKLPWTGACLCGQVRIKVAQAPVFAAACHCRACQKLTGGAYSLSLIEHGDARAVRTALIHVAPDGAARTVIRRWTPEE